MLRDLLHCELLPTSGSHCDLLSANGFSLSPSLSLSLFASQQMAAARSAQRATKAFSAQIGPHFRYLIRRNLRRNLPYVHTDGLHGHRVLGLIAYRSFEIPWKFSVWQARAFWDRMCSALY